MGPEAGRLEDGDLPQSLGLTLYLLVLGRGQGSLGGLRRFGGLREAAVSQPVWHVAGSPRVGHQSSHSGLICQMLALLHCLHPFPPLESVARTLSVLKKSLLSDFS